MITVELPWPHKDLSPNSRKHWGNRYRKAKVHKSTAMALTLHAAGWRLPAAGMNPTGPFVLTLKFIPPANRHYDLDNLIARMKSPLDGVAQALSTDDRRFRFGEITLEPAQKPGKVIVTIQEAA